MRIRGFDMGLRARRACVALCLWSACALAGEAPSAAAPAKPAPAPAVAAPAAPAPSKPEPAAAAPSAAATTEAATTGAPAPAPAPMAEPRFDDKFSLDSQEPPETESVGWALFRSTMVLGAVLALIYLTLNVGLRRLMGLRLGSSGREPLVTVVERIPLDPKRSMFVVKAAGEYLLVGAGDNALNLISKLDPEEVARMQRQPSTSATTPVISPFLQKLLSRRGGSQPPSA